MDSITLDILRRNAFRTLGLTANASQSQIDSAARMMRLMADDQVPPTPNDAPWLGPLYRTPRDIDHAVMRLADPATRLPQRLWWFCNQPPASDQAAPIVDIFSTAAVRHDAALARLCRLLVISANQKALDSWRLLLSEFRDLSTSDDYLQWMLQAEAEGEFEKRANPEELINYQTQMAQHAAACLVTMAEDFADEENFPAAGSVIALLNETHATTHPAALRILNRMEDSLVAQCNDILAQVTATWETKKIKAIKPACVRGLLACQGPIQSLTDELLKWLHADPDRSQRLRAQVLKVYLHIADAYEACHDKFASRQTLMKSLPIAQGTLAEPGLRTRIASLTSAKPVREETSTGGGYRDYFSGGNRWIITVVVIIVINLLRVCAMNTSSSRSTSYDTPTHRFQDDPDYKAAQKYLNDPNFTQALSQSTSTQRGPNDPTFSELLQMSRDAQSPSSTQSFESRLKERLSRAGPRPPTTSPSP